MSSLADSSTTAAAVSNAQVAPSVPSTLPRAVAAASSALAQSSPKKQPVLFIVMGTSGSGKSTLGALLASSLSIPFIDADDLHPSSNVAKMSSGIPLDDANREPWLIKVRQTGLDLASCSASTKATDITPAHEMSVEQRQQLRREAEAYEASYLSRHEGKGPLGLQAGSVSRFTQVTQPDDNDVKACVVACSALKRSYRDLLRGQIRSLSDPSAAPSAGSFDGARTVHIYLRVSVEELLRRMTSRKGHFMKEGMLRSQLATLEEPPREGEKDIIVVDEQDEGEKTGLDSVVSGTAIGADGAAAAAATETQGTTPRNLQAEWDVQLKGSHRTGHISKPLPSTTTPGGKNKHGEELSSLSSSLRQMQDDLNEVLTKLKDEVPKEEEKDAEALGFGKAKKGGKVERDGGETKVGGEEEEEEEDNSEEDDE